MLCFVGERQSYYARPLAKPFTVMVGVSEGDCNGYPSESSKESCKYWSVSSWQLVHVMFLLYPSPSLPGSLCALWIDRLLAQPNIPLCLRQGLCGLSVCGSVWMRCLCIVWPWLTGLFYRQAECVIWTGASESRECVGSSERYGRHVSLPIKERKEPVLELHIALTINSYYTTRQMA